jgi:predicted ATPase/DNA-binding winged helix-turn-helix (wHTH) protein
MTDAPNHIADGVIAFGPFRLFAVERLIERSGEPLQLGGRAMDVLIALVDRAGDVLSRRDLIDRVWPNVTVEDSNLRVHVAALRKALGDGQDGARYVINVPGRGYCFVSPTTRSPIESTSAPIGPISAAPVMRPRLRRMVGRDAVIEAIAAQLVSQRFVTIVGPGGIGKTTVAVSVSHALAAEYGAVCFVDLGSLADPRLVPSLLAAALGLVVQSDNLFPSLVGFLRDKRMLLILDGCEHVIETAAGLAEAIFEQTEDVDILATSREALRTEGEHVHRLAPLECPPVSDTLTAAECLASPAAQLFIERAAAGSHTFAMTDSDAPIVAEICRRLDGIALAIELAAGRVNTFGIRGVAERLNDRFKLLTRGRRTALVRHQTMRAALSWSDELLPEAERIVLRRLAIFAENFTIEAGAAVVASDEIAAPDAIDGISSLVAKSLVAADFGEAVGRYRLLDTTRAYAMEKLIESGECDEILRRHALYFLEFLEHSHADRLELTKANEVVGFFGDHVGNVRAALEWSFSAHGDLDIGTRLASAAGNFFQQLSQWSEAHAWTERAVAVLSDKARGSRREMELLLSLGMSLMSTKGGDEEVRPILSRGYELAEAHGDAALQLLFLQGLYFFGVRTANIRDLLPTARRAELIAEREADVPAIALARGMIGDAYHYSGCLADAQRYCVLALTEPAKPHRVNLTRVDISRRSMIYGTLARILWLRGYSDQAVKAGQEGIELAETLSDPPSAGIAILWAAFVPAWTGNWAEVAACIGRLEADTKTVSLRPFAAAVLGLKGELAVGTGDAEAGIYFLRNYLATSGPERLEVMTPTFAGALARGLSLIGQFDEALAVIDDGLAAIATEGSFYAPEMLRIKGSILASKAQPDLPDAEDCFLRSLASARDQFALSWELRTAVSLARLQRDQNRPQDASALLEGVYGRFSEGFGTADLIAARNLIQELSSI